MKTGNTPRGATTTIALVLLLALALLPACSSKQPDPETPHEGVQAIIALYEKRDFDALVRTRYAELAKAKSETEVQALIDKLSTIFGQEPMLKKAIATYNSLLTLEPELSDDGNTATFSAKEGTVKLSRMADGTWGFHL